MSAKDTAVINLVINGEAAKTSLREITGSVSAVRSELARMNAEQDPARYRELIAQERALTAAQRERRDEVFGNTRAIQEQRVEQKGFFADFKDGFSQINEMAGAITAGTLIASFVRGAISSVGEFFSSSQKEFEEAERTQAQLQAVLTSTGGAAGVSKKQLEDYQKTLMDQTGVDDDVIAKGEELLLTFSNIHGKIYDQALPAIVDMTAAMNGGKVSMEGIQATSLQVGKALNDPITGMTSLRKVGVTFNDQQKEQIKVMQQNGDLMGAQTVIIKELNKEFGGTAVAIRDSAVGALQAFDTDLGNLKEKVGSWIVDVKGYFADLFDPLIKSLGGSASAAEEAADAYYKTNDQLKNLQDNIVPLLDRYDVLKTKTNLTKQEHIELQNIIEKVNVAMPGMASEFDSYGKSIGLSTDRAREFIEQQKKMLTYLNRDAISKTTDDIAGYTEQIDKYAKALKSGYSEDAVNKFFGGNGRGIKLNDKQLADAQQKLAEYGQLKAGAEAALKKLQGVEDDAAGPDNDNIKKLKLSEMTVGQLQEKLQSLNEALKDTKIGSADYKKAITEINEVEKMLSQTKDDKNAVGTESKENAQLAKYNNQLDQVRSQYLQLAEAAKKGTVDDLDAQLAVIDKKYQDLIKKLQKLADTSKDPAVKKELLSDIENISKAGGLEDQDKAGTTKADAQKKTEAGKKQKAAQDKLANGIQSGVEGIITEGFDKQRSDLDDQQAQELALVNTQEAQQAIKEKYRSLDLDLEKKYLSTLKQYREASGKSTVDLEKKIGKNETDITADTTEKKIKLRTQEYEIAKLITNGLSDLIQITMGNSALGVAFQKGVTLAQLAIDTASAISSVTAQNAKSSYTPIDYAIRVAAAVVTVLANIAAAKSALSQSNDVKAPGQVKKAASGAVIPQGPSHSDGGINLVNNKTGQPIAEMEGGEPIFIFSKEAYANNADLINRLMYNSLYRNGAAVDTTSVSRGISIARSGGVFNQGATSSTSTDQLSPAAVNHQIDLSPVVNGLKQLENKIKNQKIYLNRTTLARFDEQEAEIFRRANGG